MWALHSDWTIELCKLWRITGWEYPEKTCSPVTTSAHLHVCIQCNWQRAGIKLGTHWKEMSSLTNGHSSPYTRLCVLLLYSEWRAKQLLIQSSVTKKAMVSVLTFPPNSMFPPCIKTKVKTRFKNNTKLRQLFVIFVYLKVLLLGVYHLQIKIDWLTDWLTDWQLTDWLIDWLIDWLNKGLSSDSWQNVN